MAKNIQIIFGKTSGIGILLEGKNLEDYERLHQDAIDAYKHTMKILDNHGGKMIKCSFQPISQKEISPEDLSAPTDRIIMIKDNHTVILFQGEAFTCYQRQHFEGLAFIGKKQKITGRFVKIST